MILIKLQTTSFSLFMSIYLAHGETDQEISDVENEFLKLHPDPSKFTIVTRFLDKVGTG